MALLKIQLTRNLRRTVLRGHPWIYKEALKSAPKLNRAELCQVLDSKNEFLAWALYDPHGPLSLRILSLKKNPPNFDFFQEQFSRSLNLRKTAIPANTNSYRLFN